MGVGVSKPRPDRSASEEAEWVSKPVWRGVENLASTGIRSPDRPARSKSLYRLRYPGQGCVYIHTYTHIHIYIHTHTYRPIHIYINLTSCPNYTLIFSVHHSLVDCSYSKHFVRMTVFSCKIQAVPNLGARSTSRLNFLRWRLIFLYPVYGTCFMSPSWNLEF